MLLSLFRYRFITVDVRWIHCTSLIRPSVPILLNVFFVGGGGRGGHGLAPPSDQLPGSAPVCRKCHALLLCQSDLTSSEAAPRGDVCSFQLKSYNSPVLNTRLAFELRSWSRPLCADTGQINLFDFKYLLRFYQCA